MAAESPILELAERIRLGERSAERELVARFYRPVYAMVVARTGDPEVARDLTQEVLLSVLCALRDGRLEHPGSLVGFICGTMRNQVRYHFRSLHPERSGELPEELALEQLNPEERLATAELRALADTAIARLSSDDQKILRLTLVEGLSPGEIAERLGLKPEVVRKRKSRAIRRVRKMLRREMSRD